MEVFDENALSRVGTEGYMEVLYSYLGMFCGGESKARL